MGWRESPLREDIYYENQTLESLYSSLDFIDVVCRRSLCGSRYGGFGVSASEGGSVCNCCFRRPRVPDVPSHGAACGTGFEDLQDSGCAPRLSSADASLVLSGSSNGTLF